MIFEKKWLLPASDKRSKLSKQMRAEPPARRHQLAWALAVLLVVLAAAVAGSRWWRQTHPVSLLRPHDAQVLALGERVCRQQCAACHGAQGQGQPNWRERGPDGLLPAPPHDAIGHTWHHPDAQLIAITRYGVARVIGQPGYASAMPAYAGVLSDAEIVAVLSWIKSRWPADVQARHDRVNQQAAEGGG